MWDAGYDVEIKRLNGLQILLIPPPDSTKSVTLCGQFVDEEVKLERTQVDQVYIFNFNRDTP